MIVASLCSGYGGMELGLKAAMPETEVMVSWHAESNPDLAPVTDHLPRAKALKALGNGVVPQQAAYAWRLLVKGGEYAEGQ